MRNRLCAFQVGAESGKVKFSPKFYALLNQEKQCLLRSSAAAWAGSVMARHSDRSSCVHPFRTYRDGGKLKELVRFHRQPKLWERTKQKPEYHSLLNLC